MAKPQFIAKKDCLFCRKKMVDVDYKEDVRLLQKYVTYWGKIETARRSGTCHKHQRSVSTAIKRARHLALLPFTTK